MLLKKELGSRWGQEGDPEKVTPIRQTAEEWRAEHAEKIEAERQARARLRASVLEFLGVTEEDLSGQAAAKQILSSAAVDERGKPYPDIVIEATPNTARLRIFDRLSDSTPEGWTMRPLNTDFRGTNLDEALSTEIKTTQYMPIHQVPEISADSAFERLSAAVEFTAEHPGVYDLEGAVTQLRPATEWE